MDDEHFRYCIYCRADCHDYEPEHAQDCPVNTRLFPVTEQELAGHGFGCCDCHEQFALGDHYTYRKIDDTEPKVYEVVCLGCAVLDPEIETA